MWSLWFIFILLQYASFAQVETVTLGDTINCLKKEGVFKNYDYVTNDVIRQTGQSFKVFGLTSYCYVYAGYFHELLQRKNVNEISSHPINETNRACKYKQIVQMRTEGLDELLLLVIDRFGRRVRVQSAVSGPVVENATFTWIKLMYNDRRQQFYTEPIPSGFVIQSFVNVNYRVFLVAISARNVKLMELRVFSEKVTLKPYVIVLETKDNGNIEIKNALVTPHIGIFARAVHDLQIGEKKEHRYGHGLAFSHRMDLHEPLSTVIPAVVMETLIINEFYNYRGSYPNSRFIYRKSDDTDLVVRYPQPETKSGQECVGWLNYLMLYHRIVPKIRERDEPEYNLEGSDAALRSISKRYFLNTNNMHSRMTYPHASREYVDLEIISKGWNNLWVIILVTTIVLVGISVGLWAHSTWKRKKDKRNGGTSSLTNMTS